MLKILTFINLSIIVKRRKEVSQVILCVLVGGILSEPSLAQNEAKSRSEFGKKVPVVETFQGKMAREMIRESEKLHLETMKVKDEQTFQKYKTELAKIEKRIKAVLLRLKGLSPLPDTEKISLQKALLDKEKKITQMAETAYRHVQSIGDLKLRKKVRSEQDLFYKRLEPLITEQSKRHYEPIKKQKP